MGNRHFSTSDVSQPALRPASALDDAPPGVEAPTFYRSAKNVIEAPTFFRLRYPEKYRCVCELEDTVKVLSSAAHTNQAASAPMVWDDYEWSHRSAINCLRNCIMHLKTSVVEGRTKRSARGWKQVSVCEIEEVVERWGDAEAFLFTSEEPPSFEEDPPGSAPAPSSAPMRKYMRIEGKARVSTLGTCWEGDEGADDLSGASTPVISSLIQRLRSR
ncbi:hypothetical protein T484DRAFT_1787846 [Baffinella frigidus]|nr:hypothetical protein T484DRAFT_1787846 [Cryptophyta sp. CCMP2293]